MSRKIAESLALIVLLVLAALFRFHGLKWDGKIAAHPDERYVLDVASRLSWPDALNPFDSAPDFAYGHAPLYLLALVRLPAPGVDPLLLGRALSAAFDLGTVLLTFALARQVYDVEVGLLAAIFVGLTVAHVQQAHFYTSDTLLTFFAVATLLFAIRFTENGRTLDLWLAGATAGLAFATKATAGLLVVPLSLACTLGTQRPKSAIWRCGLAALLAWVMWAPFTWIELPTYVRNLTWQAAIVRGAVDVPYTRQYHATIPYLYPLVQQLRWGMGWLLGLCALAGLTRELARIVTRPVPVQCWTVLAWMMPFFSFVGAQYAKFPRYLLPIIPIFAIYAARLLIDLLRWRRRLGVSLSLVIIGSLLLRCLALTAMYRVPHPWVTASQWIYDHVAPGSTLAVEAWDHPLPVDAARYRLLELPIFEEDDPAKWAVIDEALPQADYLIIASRRGYASLTRWPERYPRVGRYYRHLFQGALSFEPVACFSRAPRLGPFVAADDPSAGLPFSLPEQCQPAPAALFPLGRLDESFVVYDHPRVIIFRARPP